jgi:hypothetical protein
LTPTLAEPRPAPPPPRPLHPAPCTLHPRLETLLVALLILAYLAIQLPTLTRFPPVNNDEGREANLYWVAAGIDPAAQRMNAYRSSGTWGTGGLQGATTALLFRMGHHGLLPGSLVFQARLTSLLWGAILLAAVYWLGRWYWGRAVGLAATVLFAVSEPFLLATHTLRPDLQAIALVLWAVAAVEYHLVSGRRWPAVAAGVLLILAFDNHMFTLGLSSMVLAVPIVRHGRQILRRPAVWLIAAGVGLGLLYYTAVRILPDPAGWFTAARYWMGIDKGPPALSQDSGGLLGLLKAELLRYADHFGASPAGVEEWPELLLLLFGLLFGGWRAIRGSRAERTLLLGLALTAVFFVLVVKTKSRYYMIDTYPVHILLTAAALHEAAMLAARRLPRPAPRSGSLPRPATAHALLAALVLLALAWPLKFEERAWDKYVRASKYRAGQEYYELTRELDQLAGPNARIMAPPLYWFGLGHHQFVDIFVFERVKKQFGESPADFLAATQPDFVIADAKIATDRTIERELYRALDDRARYELIRRHKSYGDVAIYRLTWP